VGTVLFHNHQAYKSSPEKKKKRKSDRERRSNSKKRRKNRGADLAKIGRELGLSMENVGTAANQGNVSDDSTHFQPTSLKGKEGASATIAKT